jgi:protein-tyrosine phosphatase
MEAEVAARTVVFVCTGNICRSPLAEAMATQMAASAIMPDGVPMHQRFRFESAGTASWHVGAEMDPRAQAALRDAGFAAHQHAAKHADDELLARTDLLVALDRKHRQILAGRTSNQTDIVMLRPFDPAGGGRVDVADPYYGNESDFAACAQIIERSVSGLLTHLSAGAT